MNGDSCSIGVIENKKVQIWVNFLTPNGPFFLLLENSTGTLFTENEKKMNHNKRQRNLTFLKWWVEGR